MNTQSKVRLNRFWRNEKGSYGRQALTGLQSLGVVLLCGLSAKAQNVTFYNALSCKLSVNITYSNTNCPDTAPFCTVCTNLNSPGTTIVPRPVGYSNVVSI